MLEVDSLIENGDSESFDDRLDTSVDTVQCNFGGTALDNMAASKPLFHQCPPNRQAIVSVTARSSRTQVSGFVGDSESFDDVSTNQSGSTCTTTGVSVGDTSERRHLVDHFEFWKAEMSPLRRQQDVRMKRVSSGICGILLVVVVHTTLILCFTEQGGVHTVECCTIDST